MKITFGVNAYNAMRSLCYISVIFFVVLVQMRYMQQLELAQRSLFTLQMANVSSVDSNFYCDIPFENCRCSIISIKGCLTDENLRHVRVVPLILFVLEVYLIRKLTSLSGNYVYILTSVLWIIVLLTFISLLIVIYWKRCYYDYIAIILCEIGYLLLGFVCFEVARDKGDYVPPADNNIVTNTQARERTNNLG